MHSRHARLLGSVWLNCELCQIRELKSERSGSVSWTKLSTWKCLKHWKYWNTTETIWNTPFKSVWYVKWCFMSLYESLTTSEVSRKARAGQKRQKVASIVVQLWRWMSRLQGCNGNETQRSNSWKASRGFERLLSFAGQRKELFKMEWVSDQLQYCLLQSFSNSHASQVFTISMKACYFHEPLPIYIIIGFVFTWGPGFWPVSSSRALSGLKPLPLDSLWTGM